MMLGQSFLSLKRWLKNALISTGVLRGKLRDCDYHKRVPLLQEGGDIIKEILSSSKSGCILRMGAFEAVCCGYYHMQSHRVRRRYPSDIKKQLHFIAGFFPVDNASLDKFSRAYLDDVRTADAVALLRYGKENILLKCYCPEAELLLFRSLEPWLAEDPWTESLGGKTILVVHPFEKTILQQFEKRGDLFSNKRILPDFRLKTLKAVQTVAGIKTEYETWFEALDAMCQKIKKIDFEIAIIGAGAYGLPLAAYVKRIGKKAIHMGGATQLLFGIKGKRWDKDPLRSWLYNKYWVRPLPEETPAGIQIVEDGCYW